MKAHAQKDHLPTEKELFVKMIIDAWELQNLRVDEILKHVSDEQLQAETAPGKNSGVYLVGHLTAVSDNLLPILGFGEKLYPQLEDIFLKNPDKSGIEKPSVEELKRYWSAVNTQIRHHINKMTVDDWFAKHTAISDEDFAKEPHRNKLNVLISRTNHQSYHLGQITFLAKK